MAETVAAGLVTMQKGGFPALGSKISVVEATIDLVAENAANVAAGGGVLATGDIIQSIALPAGSVVVSAGIQIMETLVGVAAFPVSLGVTTIDPNAWITVVDIGSSTSFVLTDYVTGVPAGADGTVVIGTGAAGAASDTIDVLLGTVTATTVTAGKLRVFALVYDGGDLTG